MPMRARLHARSGRVRDAPATLWRPRARSWRPAKHAQGQRRGGGATGAMAGVPYRSGTERTHASAHTRAHTRERAAASAHALTGVEDAEPSPPSLRVCNGAPLRCGNPPRHWEPTPAFTRAAASSWPSASACLRQLCPPLRSAWGGTRFAWVEFVTGNLGMVR